MIHLLQTASRGLPIGTTDIIVGLLIIVIILLAVIAFRRRKAG